VQFGAFSANQSTFAAINLATSLAAPLNAVAIGGYGSVALPDRPAQKLAMRTGF
jgi:hypothetical protein